MNIPPSSPDNRRRVLRAAIIVCAAAIASWIIFKPPPLQMIPWPGDNIIRMRRPDGMAPLAFKAYIQACHEAGVNPKRVTQTIGDSPRSFGYHLKDGTLKSRGERIEYSAATDIHVAGLNDAQIARLVRSLGRNGFACWYRHEGKWKGVEHIHAVYAFVPMKPQLKRQVKLYLREEKPHWMQKWLLVSSNGKPLHRRK